VSVIATLADRHATYLATPILTEIAECDDMLIPGREPGYWVNGRAAIDVLLSAMLAAQRTEFAAVLDLPCGGGRVTRHLVAFFPDSVIYASDIDAERQRWVVAHLGATPFDPPNFQVAPARTFDLIFVGSLLTHFPADLFTQALTWFIAALAPDGLLVVTLHGRAYPELHTEESRAIRDLVGFAFRETTGHSYGDALTTPSWVLRHVETNPAVRIIGYHEGGWNGVQDVVVLQRRTC